MCLSGEGGEVLVHVDDQQLQLLSRGDGRSTEELDVLSWGQRQAEVVRTHGLTGGMTG